MAMKALTKTFFIVNDFDRPEEQNLTEYRDGKYYYVHPSRKGCFTDGMTAMTPTDATDFGVWIRVIGKEVKGKVVDDSIATYSNDGSPRRWQGKKEFSFKLS